MQKARSNEIVELIKILKREKEEKAKAAEAKKTEVVEEDADANKPRIRTRFWKQNENNRTQEEDMLKRGKKDKKVEYVKRLKQMLGCENIVEEKALGILLKNNNNVKKSLTEVQVNIDSYRNELVC